MISCCAKEAWNQEMMKPKAADETNTAMNSDRPRIGNGRCSMFLAYFALGVLLVASEPR